MGNCTEVHRVCHRVTQRDVVTNDRTYLRLSEYFFCADLREKSRKSEARSWKSEEDTETTEKVLPELETCNLYPATGGKRVGKGEGGGGGEGGGEGR